MSGCIFYKQQGAFLAKISDSDETENAGWCKRRNFKHN